VIKRCSLSYYPKPFSVCLDVRRGASPSVRNFSSDARDFSMKQWRSPWPLDFMWSCYVLVIRSWSACEMIELSRSCGQPRGVCPKTQPPCFQLSPPSGHSRPLLSLGLAKWWKTSHRLHRSAPPTGLSKTSPTWGRSADRTCTSTRCLSLWKRRILWKTAWFQKYPSLYDSPAPLQALQLCVLFVCHLCLCC